MSQLELAAAHDRLTAADLALAERHHLEARLATAQTAAATAGELVTQARAHLARETADVERLESFSPTRIWAALRGSRDADLSREEAERQAAAYEVAVAENGLRQAVDAVERVQRSIASLGDPAAERAAALDAKQSLLTAAGGARGAELTALATRIATCEVGLREATEADAAATAAMMALEAAGSHLDSASGWAAWDTFGGGGILSDMMKYDRMDRAQALIREANNALGVLARELRDVELPPIDGVSVTDLESAFDVWFDNIFSDWAVAGRIREASDRVRTAVASVIGVRNALAQRSSAWAAERAAAASERERLLMADDQPQA